MSTSSIQAAIGAAEPARDPMLDGCPIQPIGHRSGRYYFLSPVGELRVVGPSDFTVNGLMSLFEGDITWLYDKFPRPAGRGEHRIFNATEAAQFLISACRDEGLFDDTIPVRGLGVWRDSGPDSQGRPGIVVHCGNLLWRDGTWSRAGCKIGHAVYPAAPPVPVFADAETTPADGQLLFDAVKRWNWRRPDIDPILFTGFLAQAMLGGAPPWRAHMMVNGQPGCGKSSLGLLASTVLGASAHPQSNNYTEAGLRQALTNEARTLILDEAEAEEGGGRIMKVIELLRHMSGGDGARALRGSSGGVSQTFTVTGCALMLSILRVPLKQQDRSRITSLHLDPLPSQSPEAFAAVEEATAALKKISAGFRGRMIKRWGQFLANYEFYRGSFIGQSISARGADQLAAIFAGHDTLLYETVTTSSNMDIELLTGVIETLAVEEQAGREENEGTQALNHLLSAQIDIYRNGERQTLGQLIAKACERATADPKNDNKSLGLYGIKVDYPKETPNTAGALVVASRHQGLEKVFSGTRWASGAWIAALEYLGGVNVSPTRFAGAVARGLTIPKEHWPTEGEVS